jgi:hypothetical protein
VNPTLFRHSLFSFLPYCDSSILFGFLVITSSYSTDLAQSVCQTREDPRLLHASDLQRGSGIVIPSLMPKLCHLSAPRSLFFAAFVPRPLATSYLYVSLFSLFSLGVVFKFSFENIHPRSSSNYLRPFRAHISDSECFRSPFFFFAVLIISLTAFSGLCLPSVRFTFQIHKLRVTRSSDVFFPISL